MRAAYLALGVLLGMLVTANRAHAVIDYLTETYEQEISTYTLVGFYEGWGRGRDYTRRILYWQLANCASQLNRKGRGK